MSFLKFVAVRPKERFQIPHNLQPPTVRALAANFLAEAFRTRKESAVMNVLLRQEGIVPPKSIEAAKEKWLDLMEAAVRWNARVKSENLSLEYQRFNPERGKLSDKILGVNQQEDSEDEEDYENHSCAASVSAEDEKLMVRLCRQCRVPCPNQRRSFCSDACLHFYLIRSRASYVRKCLLVREAGVCQICGLDTEHFRKLVTPWLRKLPAAQRPVYLAALAQKPGHPHARLSKRGRIQRGSLWHADHIIPVCKGGGNSTLENFRTLCLQCHKRETAELAAQKRDERSNSIQTIPPNLDNSSGGDPPPLKCDLKDTFPDLLTSAILESHIPLIERLKHKIENSKL